MISYTKTNKLLPDRYPAFTTWHPLHYRHQKEQLILKAEETAHLQVSNTAEITQPFFFFFYRIHIKWSYSLFYNTPSLNIPIPKKFHPRLQSRNYTFSSENTIFQKLQGISFHSYIPGHRHVIKKKKRKKQRPKLVGSLGPQFKGNVNFSCWKAQKHTDVKSHSIVR